MASAFSSLGFASDPAGASPSGRPSRPRPDESSAGRKPILVVDDDPEILAMLRDFLESEGHTVRTAANGEEALEVLGEMAPSLILLDMRMPVLDGWGFAERYRERALAYPIIVMTAAESARRWAEEIGATAYIAKPFDVNELLQMIERHSQKDGKPS
jgi:CheY-like chemotaxis protein